MAAVITIVIIIDYLVVLEKLISIVGDTFYAHNGYGVNRSVIESTDRFWKKQKSCCDIMVTI